jgi:fructokinase
VVARLCALGAGSERDLLRALVDKFALRLAVLTRAERGSLMRTPSIEVETLAPPTTVVDSVGAGGMRSRRRCWWGLLNGQALEEVATKANAVAAYVCSQVGATPALPRA